MSSVSDPLPAIVIDGGSSLFKGGLAGDDVASTVFPSLVSRSSSMPSDDLNAKCQKAETFVCGDVSDIANKQDIINCRYPIEHGIVTNWDDWELLLAHCFQNLRVDPEEHGLLISDPPLNPRANRERILQLNFEAFNVPASHLSNSAQLILYTAGRHTGIVTDVGGGIVSCVPFFESHWFPDGIQRQDFGGQDLTIYLQKLLREKGLSFATTSELELVRKMKERLCYVSYDYSIDINAPNSSAKQSFSLPDGSTVVLDKERFQIPEALFNPSLAGFSHLTSLPDLIKSSLSMCDRNAQTDMFVNLIISGGCTLHPGFSDRLTMEMRKRIPSIMKMRVVPLGPAALYGPWIGGSIAASLSTFQHAWISKQDYYEKGPSRLCT